MVLRELVGELRVVRASGSSRIAGGAASAGEDAPMDTRDVDQAVAEMVRVLGPHVDRDWQALAGLLEWTCWDTAVHVASD